MQSQPVSLGAWTSFPVQFISKWNEILCCSTFSFLNLFPYSILFLSLSLFQIVSIHFCWLVRVIMFLCSVGSSCLSHARCFIKLLETRETAVVVSFRGFSFSDRGAPAAFHLRQVRSCLIAIHMSPSCFNAPGFSAIWFRLTLKLTSSYVVGARRWQRHTTMNCRTKASAQATRWLQFAIKLKKDDKRWSSISFQGREGGKGGRVELSELSASSW